MLPPMTLLRFARGRELMAFVIAVAAMFLTTGAAAPVATVSPEIVALHARLGTVVSNSGCQACHAQHTVSSHPVGVVPSMQVPATYPLDSAG